MTAAEGERTSERVLRAQKGAETRQARAYATGFRVGDLITTDTPRSARFHNRRGQVVTTNLGEVGISFTAADRVDAWFLPAELWHH